MLLVQSSLPADLVSSRMHRLDTYNELTSTLFLCREELYTNLITIAKCPHFLAFLHVEQSQSWCLKRIAITLQVSLNSTIHLIKLCSVPI